MMVLSSNIQSDLSCMCLREITTGVFTARDWQNKQSTAVNDDVSLIKTSDFIYQMTQMRGGYCSLCLPGSMRLEEASSHDVLSERKWRGKHFLQSHAKCGNNKSQIDIDSVEAQ